MILNSLGEFKSEIKEVSQEDFYDLNQYEKIRIFVMVHSHNGCYSFVDETGQELILQTDLFSNSLIKIVNLD
ncbi:hypothetical protein b3_0071 [Synechococcus phage B3]|nr:hypothetical protein b3_0071 [Synechococcus phage B3]QGT54687.1 hypothetical protein b23_0070 [Synechococcus phage B23]